MVLLRLLTFTLLSSYFHPATVVDARPQCTKKSLDLVFLFDGSASMTPDDFNQCKDFIKDTMKSLKNTSIEFAAVQFSSESRTVFDFNDYRNGRADGKLDKETQMEQLTNTYAALRFVLMNIFEKPASGASPNATKVLVLITDGDSTDSDNSWNIRYDVKRVIQFSIQIHVQRWFKIKSIASLTTDNYVFKIKKYEELRGIAEDVKNRILKLEEDSIPPALEIYSQSKVFEGDQLNVTCDVSCTVRNMLVDLYLRTKRLSRGGTFLSYTMVAQAKGPLDFECRLAMGNVTKIATWIASVNELFSSPTLTVFPADVFQGEKMSLTCNSERFASERIKKEELIYTLEPPDSRLISTKPGVFSGKALDHDVTYTCEAEARGVKKRSETLTVRPKVPVSTPKISVVDQAISGRPAKIRCHSDSGDLPIDYTLLRNGDRLKTIAVKLRTEKAVFTVTIDKPEEISEYMCEAKNNHKDAKLSQRLDAPLTGVTREEQRNINAAFGPDNVVPRKKVPEQVSVSTPKISVVDQAIPGQPVKIRCHSDSGDLPINYTLLRNGDRLNTIAVKLPTEDAVFTVTIDKPEELSKYMCEAKNNHKDARLSQRLDAPGHMALWKKAVIAGVCLMVASLLVYVLYIKSTMGRGSYLH